MLVTEFTLVTEIATESVTNEFRVSIITDMMGLCNFKRKGIVRVMKTPKGAISSRP